ncbi:hypothetical protein [Methylobacterium oxalidis]|uniref:Uncharacterized protein n=1 Tax=Methylobacterium oxalidis TaxID=944322 RepID=A0A512IZ88_9HYPH|nr:hypothetical protein [Methylobacterium oxalidis]GEP02995.1 hypothetical protein MOX02_10330 [Methylobacterium oxalidis]GJE33186.1 hypothetical protein LDDCCGHA_3385 [Methylobacterium oxalidis]GLS65928.1 hypothetical protein GCM10007888_43100 [Methylobacterium oxalidis]
MMNVSIDPSEARTAAVSGDAEPSRQAATTSRPALGGKLRIVLLGGLALGGVAAFSSASMSFLGGLAGPPPKPIAINRSAADWPDLRDGVPALATGSVAREAAVVTQPAETPALPLPEPVAPLRAALDAQAQPSEIAAPAPQPVPARPAAEKVPAKRAPMIENVATVAPAREAVVVSAVKTAHALSPARSQTVKARTADVAFAALPPEPAKETAKEAAKEAFKDAPKEAAKPRSKTAAAKPPAARKTEVASAEPAPTAAAADEPETTEVFGLKVPSLAPAGRKLRESVEALGEAVKGLPEKF